MGASILDGVLERGPFAGEGGRTGASFERAVLADGTPVVIKHISSTDWMSVVAGGVSYLARCWDGGVFARMPDTIDHTTLAVEPTESGFVVVMRDVTEHVLVEGRVLSREENLRVMRSMDTMYEEFWGETGLGCPLSDHFTIFSPRVVERVEHLDTPVPGLMRRGWEMFGDVAPSDVTSVMHSLISDPSPLVRALEQRPMTLVHGDLRLHNMGISSERLVLLDWELVGSAPPAVEFCWYLIISASRIAATRDQVTDDFRDICGDRFDADGLELGMISALLFLGWNKAIDIVENPDPVVRAQERADLDWWIARVRRALEEWSPI
jgi:phosphotransferase family enzyme